MIGWAIARIAKNIVWETTICAILTLIIQTGSSFTVSSKVKSWTATDVGISEDLRHAFRILLLRLKTNNLLKFKNKNVPGKFLHIHKDFLYMVLFRKIFQKSLHHNYKQQFDFLIHKFPRANMVRFQSKELFRNFYQKIPKDSRKNTNRRDWQNRCQNINRVYRYTHRLNQLYRDRIRNYLFELLKTSTLKLFIIKKFIVN